MRKHVSFRLLFLLLYVALASQAAAKPAKSKEETAATLFAAAEIFFKAEEYERALAAYLESYELSSYPALLFNVGQCYRSLNKYRDALKAYQGYLDAVPNSPIRKEVERWIDELKPLAAQEQTQPTNEPAKVEPPKEAPVVAPTPLVPTPADTPESSASLRPFLLPLGLGLGGLALGSSAVAVQIQIQQSDEITNALARSRLLLAASADVAFLAAGASLFFAVRKQKEPKVSLSPVSGGAVVSFSFSQGAP